MLKIAFLVWGYSAPTLWNFKNVFCVAVSTDEQIQYPLTYWLMNIWMNEWMIEWMNE